MSTFVMHRKMKRTLRRVAPQVELMFHLLFFGLTNYIRLFKIISVSYPSEITVHLNDEIYLLTMWMN